MGAATIALALIAIGALQKDGFEAMVEFTALVFRGFLCLVGLAHFALGRRQPDAPRSFRVPVYRLTPVVFVVCAFLLV